MNAAAERATGYADTLRDYIRAGLVLVPVPAGSKAPRGKGWNLRARCWASPGQVPDTYGGNVGLAHAYAGTCALDIDNAALAGPALAALGIDLAALLGAPDAVHIRSGRAGRDKLLFRLRDPLASINRSAAEGFELRCAASNGTTAQCVLPPSIHPDTGKPYLWQGDWHTLPDIPADLLALWQHLLRKPEASQSATKCDNPASVSRLPTHRRKLPDVIPEGERNATLLSLAAGLVRNGHDLLAVTRRLQRINAERCKPPLCATEVDTIAMRAIGYGSEGFAMLPHKLLDSPEWKALSPRAHDIVLTAFRRYDGANNGNIALTWDDFDGRAGFGNKDTFYKHRKRAVSAGVLLAVREGRITQTGKAPDLFGIADCWLVRDSASPKSETLRQSQKRNPYIDKQACAAVAVVGGLDPRLQATAQTSQRGTTR